MTEPFTERLSVIVNEYADKAWAQLHERWSQWPLDLSVVEVHEVVGGLLARQVTLATQLALAPQIWNGHIAPLVLRVMVDNLINLAWVFEEPLDRSRKFIQYGLGQEKLAIEHRKRVLTERGDNPALDPLVEASEAWLNLQRYSFLTEVNVGSWAGISTQKMAEKADCEELYIFAYVPFSSAVHNTWQHVERYNLQHCQNPLHRYHRVPANPELLSDPDYLLRAASYLQEAFEMFDRKASVSTTGASALVALDEELTRLFRASTDASTT